MLEDMGRTEVAVIDYGMGNLLSVRRGLEHCGATVRVTTDPEIVKSASRVVLPGVGAFSNAMEELCNKGLDVVVRDVASSGIPLLGICLGMQLLLDESEEFGLTSGLGVIPGRVVPIPKRSTDGQRQKIPHIGWNDLILPEGRKTWTGTLLQDVEPGESAYFVHSYLASPTDSSHRIADCLYGGTQVAAVIGHDNVNGCQFHPEKSGEVGLKILQRFLSQ